MRELRVGERDGGMEAAREREIGERGRNIGEREESGERGKREERLCIVIN